MAQSLEQKKSDYLSRVVEFSEEMMQLFQKAEELAAYRADNGFQTGGANPIAEADIVGANAHLTPVVVDEVVQVGAAFVGMMTLPRRASLRKANRMPQF